MVAVAGLLLTGVAGAAGTLFQPYQALDVGSWPEAVAIGDVTGDGRADVVLTTGFYFDPANDDRVWVFAQTDGGSLAAPVSYATGSTATPSSVDVGDVTGDGRADVVVGLDGTGVQVYAQLADGTLGGPSLHATTNGDLVRLGQLDGDGRLDVAAVGWGTNTVSVFLNDGAGGFQAPVQYAAQHAGYEDLEVDDVTGDGRHDLVVMSGQLYAVPNVSVLAQGAAGGFGPAAEYRVGTNVLTNGIGVGDVTGDGRADVVASYGGNRPSSNIAVFRQSEAGTLESPVAYASYDIPEPVEVADVDLDGGADVVTLHGGWSRAGVYAQFAGRLTAEDLYEIPYASHYSPHGLAVGDVSGEGSPDLVLADYNHGLVVLYGNTPPPPPPPPPSADVGVDVTASGTRVRPRKSFWFDVKVTNAGPDATAASMTVQLTGGATGLSENSASCSLQGQLVTCSFSSLAAGSSTTVRISGVAPKTGTLTAAATVDGALDDPNAANDHDSASLPVR
jgi:Domain of unknown function DUF11/FG-GAP-like repeat